MIFFAIVSSLSLSLLAPFLRAIFYNTPYSIKNDILNRISNWFLRGSKLQIFIKIQLTLVIAFILKGIFGYFHKYLAAIIEENVIKNVRDVLYSHIQFLSLDYFHNIKGGNLISRITNDIAQINYSIKDGFFEFLHQFLLIIAYFLFALYISWKLLLVTIITLPILGFWLNKLNKKLRERNDKMQEDLGLMTSITKESIDGIKIIQAFGTEHIEIKKFIQATYRYLKSAIRFERISLIGVPLGEIISAIGVCIIISYGGYLILVAKTLSPDRFFIFLACAISIMQALRQIPKANSKMQKANQAMIRVNKILATTPKIKEVENPIPVKFEKEIIFDNVYFSYDRKETIRGISFSIKKGEKIAIVGKSGSGKTTIIDLLTRFYDVQKGEIKIDGIDIKKMSIKELRSLFGIVTQEPILFNDTIFNNIAYGNSDIDPNDVYNAAKLANADEFIEKLPNGYNTIIGDRGVKLSGGERQRIAIARAIFKKPQIIIFDEATSHIDRESEIKIQQAIEKLFQQDLTIIIIAHRLTTIYKLDKIIVLDNGSLIEQGTHSELIKNSSLYKKLFAQLEY